MKKPVIFTQHARQQLKLRSVTEAEVLETLSSPQRRTHAKRGAWKATKRFAFQAQHRGVYHRQKVVEVRYLDEATAQIVLTVISKFVR